MIPHFGPAYDVEVWTSKGGHGGGDARILADLFAEERPDDPYMHAADQRAGAYSILTGVAANRSMATGEMVYIDDLVHDIGMPDYPPMPTTEDPLYFEAPELPDIPQPED